MEYFISIWKSNECMSGDRYAANACNVVGRCLVAIILLSYTTGSFGAILSVADFETGKDPLVSYGFGPSGNDTVSVVPDTKPVCSGKYSAEFSLDAYNDKVSYRTELTGGKILNQERSNLKIGSEYWIGFAVFLPSAWQKDPSGTEILWQLHGRPDSGESWRNPPMSLSTDGEYWFFTRKWSSLKLIKTKSDRMTSRTVLGRVEKDKWVEFVFHIKISYSDDGLIEIWVNGEKRKAMRGGNTYNDDVGPYMKFGIYKSSWGQRPKWESNLANGRWPKGPVASGFSKRLYYFDELRIGDQYESYGSVAPNCGNSSRTSVQERLHVPRGLSISVK